MPLPLLSKTAASPGASFEASLPLHQQITRMLGQHLESGQLCPGEMLPPELEVARQFG